MSDLNFRGFVGNNYNEFKLHYIASFLASNAAIDRENSYMSAEQRLSRVQDPDVEDAIFQAELAWNKLMDHLGE